MAREAIGLALVLEKHGGAFFGSGARPSVSLSHPGKANRKIAENMKKQWNLDHAGPPNLEKPSVLFEGVKLETYSMPNDDAQFLETRGFQNEEIGPRVFGVPTWLLGAHEHASNFGTGIEQQGIAFVQYQLLPDLKRSEQAMNMKLYTRAERKKGLFVEFNVDGLQRGDFKSRMEGHQIAVGGPFMSRDEARAKENLEVRGGQMDEVLQNLNQSTSGSPTAAAPADLGGGALQEAFTPLLRTAWLRGLRRLAEVSGSENKLVSARAYAADQVAPVLAAYRKLGGSLWRAEDLVNQLGPDALAGDLEAAAARLAASTLGA